MFLVFNKQKIYSYLIAFATVVVLLGMAKMYKGKSGEIVETIANNKKNVDVNILILNENWTDNDVCQILQLLKKYNCNTKFMVNKNWKEQHIESINQMQKYEFEILEYE